MQNATTTAAVSKAEGYLSSVSRSSSALSDPQSPRPVILSPCAACKILRRRCAADKCLLAPYFPPTEPLKFAIAHRIFGASNIIKLLQELPEAERADAVSSLVYEANARLNDPVYGCAGVICHLQKQISEVQAELAKAQAEILNLQCQNDNLLESICKQMTHISDDQQQEYLHNSNFFMDESIMGVDNWEPLWT